MNRTVEIGFGSWKVQENWEKGYKRQISLHDGHLLRLTLPLAVCKFRVAGD
jgi:hypothetical protein